MLAWLRVSLNLSSKKQLLLKPENVLMLMPFIVPSVPKQDNPLR